MIDVLPMKPTAREVLELFLPAHDMHTIADVDDVSSVAVLVKCVCGSRLMITETLCKAYMTTFRHVKEGLRNVPRMKAA